MKKLIIWLLVVFVLIGGVFIGKHFYFYSANNNRNYIPENAEFIVHINAGQLFEELFENLLIKNRDKQLYANLKKIMDKGVNDEMETGIEVLSDVILYTESIGERQLVGILLNLDDDKQFETFYNSKLKDKFYYTNNDKVVLLLMKNDSISEQYYTSYRSDFFKKKQLAFSKRFKDNDKGHLHFYNKNPEGKYLTLNVYTEKNQVKIIGNIPASKFDLNSSKFDLNSDGFHLDSKIDVNSFLNNFIQNSFSRLVDGPSIDNFIFNYYGLELAENDERKLVVIPKFDLLLKYNETYNYNTLFEKSMFTEKMNWKFKDSSLTAGPYSYAVKKLSQQDLFIGLNPQTIKDASNIYSFNMMGKPNSILQIDGGGFIGNMIVSVIPGIRQTKTFLDQIESFEIKSKMNSSEVNGYIKFGENQLAMYEVFKFLISLTE